VVYFVVAPILDIGAFASALLALSLFEGAYAAEILRAGSFPADGTVGCGPQPGPVPLRHLPLRILPQALRRSCRRWPARASR
jgi:polar amino acid transport system permease protein